MLAKRCLRCEIYPWRYPCTKCYTKYKSGLEKKMRRLKVGNEIIVENDLWSFGIQDGCFKNGLFELAGKKFTIVNCGLNVLKTPTAAEACDLLVTDNRGSLWFVRSKKCRLATHTITIDSKDIELSDESYRNLKKQLGG